MRKYFIQHLMTALGCALMGIAVNSFFIPHQLLSGGISGIAVMLYYLYNLPMGIVTILINIPLFFSSSYTSFPDIFGLFANMKLALESVRVYPIFLSSELNLFRVDIIFLQLSE